MYSRPLVPQDFVVSERLQGAGFHLRMLRIHDVVKDYDAVTSSEAHLAGFMEPGSTWPRGLTVEENLIDLAWHHHEFTIRHSFAYTVMNDDESRCLGCCYIYPSDRSGHDAMVFYWAREPELDQAIGEVLRNSISSDWPFKKVAFPGRDIAWSDW
jgi:hypothetical protein